ncbi:MAG: ChrR family anti-sigma-E factor [Hyphomicrobiales bacterium]|nr:ChrR family anti-sigma-E factor [Hyphomicrobiales bacterium]
MNAPNHHPADETLGRFAAGAIEAGPRLVVATHLAGCPQCRARIRSFESAGGVLLDSMEPATLRADAFARTLAQVEAPAPATIVPAARDAAMPAPLRYYDLPKWRAVAPGVRWRRVVLPEAPDANVIMLKVGAGQRMPNHGHTGVEYTQVIAGGYTDAFGHYVAGDCIEMDEDVEHIPLADRDGDCVVLAALEGPLRLQGWIARLFQQFIGI